MSDNRILIIQEAVIGAVKSLLTGRVNEILRDEEFDTPVIEFGNYQGESCVVPVAALASCEKSEKERIISIDAYSLTISFSLSDKFETESQCYAICAVVCMAVKENPTLGGVVDRAVVCGEKYMPPKKPHCDEKWKVVISLRVTIENER